MESSINNNRNWYTDARLWKWLLAAYWLVQFGATHVPNDFPIVPTGHWDKLAHFGAFGLLAFLCATVWQISVGLLIGAHLRFLWLLVVAYGAIDEWTQTLVGREASWLDWLADVAGAAAGLAVFQLLARSRRHRWSQSDSVPPKAADEN
jgi:VanZ family protein